MVLRGKDVALSLLTVGTAAAVGYILRSGRGRGDVGRTRADVGARVVAEAPEDATVVDVSSRRLEQLPVVRTVIERAVERDAREEWANLTLEDDRAWDIVDALRGATPYYDADDPAYNGIYVRCDDRIVVVDAIGWARVPEAFQ